MSTKKSFRLFPAYSNRMIFLGAFFLSIYGTFMIVSAEMSRDAGGNAVIIRSFVKQFIYLAIGIALMSFLARIRIMRLPKRLFTIGYFAMAGLLVSCRLFRPLGGAYAWIQIGGFTLQPSEFAKFYIIAMLARFLQDEGNHELNRQNFRSMIFASLMYGAIIVAVQRDFGSGLVLLGICYIMLLTSRLPGCREYRFWMFILFAAGVVMAAFLLSPIGTSLLMKLGESDYRIGRFLASANPFLDPYDSGFHLIMGLVSFANGGWFGMGYGNSIHKYMNFPNPSSDFILPVIIEEMGVVFGLIPILLLYAMIIVPIVRYSLKVDSERSKLILVGTFMYFILHIILNMGGVSGLIPLTGVPLLLLSSGGSSMLASLAALGLAQSEIIQYRKTTENA